MALAKKHLLSVKSVYITIFAKFHCVQKSLCVNIYSMWALITVLNQSYTQSHHCLRFPTFEIVSVCERMWVCIRSCVESCKWLNAWKQASSHSTKIFRRNIGMCSHGEQHMHHLLEWATEKGKPAIKNMLHQQ